MRRSVLLVAVMLVSILAACGDTEADAVRDAKLAELVDTVERLSVENDELREQVGRQGRQIAGLGRLRVSSGGGTASAVTAEPTGASSHASGEETADAAQAAVGEPTVPDAVVDAVLESDAGRKAIQHAAAREIEKRERKERRIFVSYQIGRFAARAGLDERATEQLQTIWKTSLDAGLELRKEFAAIGELPAAERDAARATAMENMRGIGRERLQSVRDLLDDEQFQMYEKTEDEIVEGLHGGRR